MVNSINRIIFQHLFHFKESALRAPCRRAFPFLFLSSVPWELHHIAGAQPFLAVVRYTNDSQGDDRPRV